MKPDYVLFALLAFAFGCSGGDPEPQVGQTRDRMFDSQREALDKAKSVEQQIQDAADKQRQAIDAQSGSTGQRDE